MGSRTMGRKRRWAPALLILSVVVLGLVRSSRRLASYRPKEPELDAFLEGDVPDPDPAAGRTAIDPARAPRPRPRPPPRPDPARRGGRVRDWWESGESSCVHFDDICGRNGSGWFYDPGPAAGSAPARGRRHQPTTALVVTPELIELSHGYDIEVERRVWLNVSSASGHLHGDDCSYSPTPHHMVVQSAFNDMMGEFYSRTIVGVNRWLRDFPPRSDDDLQMYVHFVDSQKQALLEGHRLFLGGLPNNNRFDNALALMPEESDSCRCYRKLVFCGYERGRFNGTAGFKPHGMIHHRDTWCTMHMDSRALERGSCVAYRRLRRELYDTYARKDPALGDRVRAYQREILLRKGLIGDDDARSGASGWKFVGLAHRKSRRRWLNIDAALSACDLKFARRRVACVAIDVEEANDPESQLLMHRSLHALVGVHGAQLTQGVLLPRHGHVLELLPWVPHYLWGGWVATTHRPTPLGIIFHNTDLNHVGYPLGRDSVPLCRGVDPADAEGDRACLMNRTSGVWRRFRWADRDFRAPVRAIEDFVDAFVLGGDGATCDEARARAEDGGFVLYNAFCRRDADGRAYASEHYYRELDETQPRNIHGNYRDTD